LLVLWKTVKHLVSFLTNLLNRLH